MPTTIPLDSLCVCGHTFGDHDVQTAHCTKCSPNGFNPFKHPYREGECSGFANMTGHPDVQPKGND